LEVTGADGVMSSEALLGNPKMFSEEGNRRFREDFARSQLQTADDFLEILQSHKLPRPLYQVVRSHLFKMLYRFSDAPNNVDLRMQLANGDFEMMKNVVVQLHDRMSKIDYQTELGVELGLIGKTHWYYRHRDEKALQRRHSIPRKKVVRAPIDLNPVNEEPADKTIKGDGVSDDLVLKMKLLKEKLSHRKTLKDEEVAQESISSSSRGMSNN
jgi:Dihydrouridine synthase (Dus)